MNESGYGVGPEFTLDTRDPEVPSVVLDFNATVLKIAENALINSYVGEFFPDERRSEQGSILHLRI